MDAQTQEKLKAAENAYNKLNRGPWTWHNTLGSGEMFKVADRDKKYIDETVEEHYPFLFQLVREQETRLAKYERVVEAAKKASSAWADGADENAMAGRLSEISHELEALE